MILLINMDADLKNSNTVKQQQIQDIKQLDSYLNQSDKEFETLYTRMNKLRSNLEKSTEKKKN